MRYENGEAVRTFRSCRRVTATAPAARRRHRRRASRRDPVVVTGARLDMDTRRHPLERVAASVLVEYRGGALQDRDGRLVPGAGQIGGAARTAHDRRPNTA